MIAMIAALVATGAAYERQGHVLFEVAKFAGYGQLSRRPMDEMIAGARVEVAPYKRAPGDFVLWKPSRDDQPGWESPWGRGRPGWHIECSAMIRSVLEAETIDIHGGGLDLTFPHHENERAQSACAHDGAELSRIWMHNGFVEMGETKMSKSLGNIVSPRELLDAGWPGEVLRLALLSAHYRQPLTWTDALLEQSRAKLDRLYRSQRGREGLPEALLDDLNTPKAFAVLPAGATVLGLLADGRDAWETRGVDAGGMSDELARYREARAARDFATADAIRDRLAAEGIAISVAKDGSTTWRRA
jgi:cysteinyl-tRNA synthetase